MDAREGLEIFDRYLSRHLAMDLAGVTSLFADDAWLEDPVGAPARRGRAEIEAFYRETYEKMGPLVIERVGPAIPCGNEIAAHVRARMRTPADALVMDVIYTVEVCSEGLIRRLRAFF